MHPSSSPCSLPPLSLPLHRTRLFSRYTCYLKSFLFALKGARLTSVSWPKNADVEGIHRCAATPHPLFHMGLSGEATAGVVLGILGFFVVLGLTLYTYRLRHHHDKEEEGRGGERSGERSIVDESHPARRIVPFGSVPHTPQGPTFRASSYPLSLSLLLTKEQCINRVQT